MDGIACSSPEVATPTWDESNHVHNEKYGRMGGHCIYLWMSDYHPDGGQLFFPKAFQGNPLFNEKQELGSTMSNEKGSFPMFACLGKSSYGDDIRYECNNGLN